MHPAAIFWLVFLDGLVLLGKLSVRLCGGDPDSWSKVLLWVVGMSLVMVITMVLMVVDTLST